jgi:hypothetical protein
MQERFRNFLDFEAAIGVRHGVVVQCGRVGGIADPDGLFGWENL